MNLQPEGPGFESPTGNIKLAIEPKLSFKSKNGFSKHCSVYNYASYVKSRAISEKIRSP